MVILTLKLIFVVCFNNTAMQRMITDENTAILSRVLE